MFLEKAKSISHTSIIDKYGSMGVNALKKNTPKDSGKTADSWKYKIERKKGGFELIFSNSNINDGVNIAILIQYDHGTRNGGFVEGIDYINPSLRPIFNKLAKELWEEVKK